jgi:hypothetical protein
VSGTFATFYFTATLYFRATVESLVASAKKAGWRERLGGAGRLALFHNQDYTAAGGQAKGAVGGK